jgi:hypothetical protein
MAERDKGYDGYHDAVKRRFGLKDEHIARGYMRGSDPSWNGRRPEDVPHTAGMTDVVLVFGNATLRGSVQPERIDEMRGEWERQFAARPENEDRRAFTRRAISEHMALNRHRDEDTATVLLCGAVWLAAGHPQSGAEILAFMKRGDVEFRYDILFNDEAQEQRFRPSVTDFRE